MNDIEHALHNTAENDITKLFDDIRTANKSGWWMCLQIDPPNEEMSNKTKTKCQ